MSRLAFGQSASSYWKCGVGAGLACLPGKEPRSSETMRVNALPVVAFGCASLHLFAVTPPPPRSVEKAAEAGGGAA